LWRFWADKSRALSAEIERVKVLNVKLCADFNLMNQHGAKQDALLADYQKGQTYRYIGKNGLPILARELEDQRDAAITALTASQAETAAAYEKALDAASNYTQRVYGDDWKFLSNPIDRERILAAIQKGGE
jgi:peptidoglycan hydrolase CwlO-like protein